MTADSSTPRRLLRFLPLLALAFENVGLFWSHYFRGYGFPWDFLGHYYAVVAYWTSGIRQDVFPQWIPFQSMGYPLSINLQSGLFYPPFWLFPAFRVAYSLHAAVWLQCLHVLLGALGVYCLLRRIGRPRLIAFLGAFAFQLFGGFYSNAEHPDIVRGFALVPWLLWSLTLAPARSRARNRALWAAPLFIFLLATGGYPGIFLSSLFCAGVWVVLQIGEHLIDGSPVDPLLGFGIAAVALLLLGVAMSFVHLGPAWLHRAELVRYHDWAAREVVALDFRHIGGLFLPNRGLPGNVSMTSTYLPLPLLVAAFWAPLSRRGTRASLALLAVAAAMVAGPASPVFRLARAVLPPLGYSRLPAADYRVFIGIALILLGTAGLENLRRPSVRFLASWRWLFVLLLFFGLPLVVFPVFFDRPARAAAAAALLAAVILLGLRHAIWRRKSLLWVGLLAVLMAIDASRILLSMQHLDGDLWRLPDVVGYTHKRFPEVFSVDFKGRVPPELFEMRPGPRGPRHAAPPGSYRAAGYLTGQLLVSDFGGTVLDARRRIEERPAFMNFMLREWTPILLVPENRSTGMEEILSAPDALSRERPSLGRVVQTAYGNERIEYEVDLDRPALLVENEIYFPGWEAALAGRNGRESLLPIKTDGAFRGWSLPAGKFQMTATFHFPGFAALATVSLVAWAVWAPLFFSAFRRRGG